MSLKKVLEAWLEYGLEPNGTAALPADDQRELVADILTEEPDMLGEAFAETFARSPILRTRFITAYRSHDAIQLFAVCDELLREHHIGSPWLVYELEDARQAQSAWDEDV